jgi:enoyl reductase-like protein
VNGKVIILSNIFRSNIIWKCPDIAKKSKPLENHREISNPVQAIVAPQRRKSSQIKERKEESVHNHIKHNQELAQEEAKEVIKSQSQKTKQKSQSTQVSLLSSRPIRINAETQVKPVADLYASVTALNMENKSSHVSHSMHKHSIPTSVDIAKSTPKESDNGYIDVFTQKQGSLTKMTPSCTSREAVYVPETTEDSLNTNITAFVSTRYGGCMC